MKPILFGALAAALLCTPALAQQRGNANSNNAFGRGGAVLQLPQGVQSVVSIDALNTILIASEGARRGETQYTPTLIKHVYSGGIAQLFGGTSIPTAQFATPGQFGNNTGGVAAVGGAQNGFGGNNGGGFGAQNNGNNNNSSFGGATFQNGALGFNTLNRNPVVNARMRAR